LAEASCAISAITLPPLRSWQSSEANVSHVLSYKGRKWQFSELSIVSKSSMGIPDWWAAKTREGYEFNVKLLVRLESSE
jgi:hypothetical protein